MKNSKSMIILLVGLAVLTLVVVVGLVLFYPKEPAKTAAAPTPAAATPANPVPDSFDPVEWGRDPQSPGLQPAAPAGDKGVTVTLPTAGLPASPGATFPGDAPAAAPAAPASPAAVTSKPVAAAPAPAAPAAPAAAPAPKAVPKAAPAPAPAKTVKVNEYWIQVASFKDRYQAENTAKALETQGLKGTLSTATVNGQTVVRVRVGPYANEAEAKKFLSWLTPVKEFSASYVTKVAARHPGN